ncbi:tetratricopeptide repeat protein [Shewanella indica]|uniref:tetratricopeptide repeat protein n=1 Tax=Shewanella indica TaxID=768528 RepID=UPI00399C2C5E
MSKELRRKTAMVLHQLEESLGSFVMAEGTIENLNTDSLDNIHKREADRGRKFNKSSIKDIVEATYLDELFGFALDITQDSSTLDSINYLYSLFHHLDIYEIRNAISHPNRTFWDCYWYRVASIASDPVNDKLRFEDVKSALAAAENNSIIDPPEEWINKIIWEIPNNLPDSFDHGLTGLIGRTKELQEIKKFINNPRVSTIALVAPGGSGKTAIALDLLNSIVSTPSYTKSVSSVIYVTMKTEKLTADGVVPLDAIETISELKQNILHSINNVYEESYETFESAINSCQNDNILLCIDNLETVLRENQSSFDDLNYQLPINWKVLVTSRVTISNATIIKVDNLSKKSAEHLARVYHSKRGGSSYDKGFYEKLSSQCYYNPLAIRLSIDLILKGKDIPESLNVANKEIAEFSYNNLIDAISEVAVEILECIFVEDNSSRLSMCGLLNKTLDEISEGVGELSRTSLITRIPSDEGEIYRLNDSVRELLLLSPRNIIIRSNVQRSIKKRKMMSQEIDIVQSAKDFPEWHTDHIDISTDENLKILITDFNKQYKKAKKSSDIAVDLYRKLKSVSFMYDSCALYHRTMSRALTLLKDIPSAIKHSERAIALDPDSPASIYSLAHLYSSSRNYKLASQEYSKLINSDWVNSEPDNLHFGKSVYKWYFLSLLFNNDWQRVLDETKKWKEDSSYRGILGTYRAAAWKKKMEHTVDKDKKETTDALISASRILKDVFRTNGYFNDACSQACKIFDEIEFCFARKSYQSEYPDEAIELLNFVYENINDVERVLKNRDLSPLVSKLSKISLVENPFLESYHARDRVIEENRPDEQIELVNGLIEVTVKNRPNASPTYLFANDDNGIDYFLHFDNFKDGNWKSWLNLSVSDRLLVFPDNNQPPGKQAKTVTEIYYVS